MLELSVLLTIFCSVCLLFTHYSNRQAKLTITLISLNFLLIILYLTADYFSLNGVDFAVFAHLHYLTDIKSYLRFWPVTLLAILGILSLIIVSRTLNNQILLVKAQPSKFTSLTLKICTPIFILLGLTVNPLITQATAFYKSHLDQRKLALPEKFAHIQQTAPPFTYQTPDINANFILIFAEGLEQKFIEDDIYPGLTPNLTQLISNKGFQIKGINELTLSNWTAAGITARMCGLSFAPNNSGHGLSDYQKQRPEIQKRIKSTNLLGETCIGDILYDDDYDLRFIGGSEFGIDFKSRFFGSQGFKKLYFTTEIEASSKVDLATNTWGVYDDALFQFAKELLQKSDQKRTSGVVILTSDTHTPGFVSPSCKGVKYLDGENELLNSVHCADSLISEFMEDILNDPKHKDTVIFLLSDHLSRGSLPNNPALTSNRSNLFTVFNSQSKNLVNKTILKSSTPLDIAPTILDHLGYDIQTLNFGRNLMLGSPTLSETLGPRVFSANIVQLRQQLRKYWEENNSTFVAPNEATNPEKR